MDTNRGNTELDDMTPAELDAEAMRRKRQYRSLDREVSRLYNRMVTLIPLRDEAETAYNEAVRRANLARHRVGAAALALAAVGLGEPIAALFG